MNVAAGPTLAAAVTNAGGLGVIGGVGYTPKVLRQQVCLLLLPPLARPAPQQCSLYRLDPDSWNELTPEFQFLK